MRKKVLRFYGSDEDLSELRKALSAAGFQEHEENIIRASHNIIPHSISFLAGVGVGKCVRAFLQVRGKRMVSRMVSDSEEKIVIRGDFSVKEIERLLKIPYNLDIKNDKDDASYEGSSVKR